VTRFLTGYFLLCLLLPLLACDNLKVSADPIMNVDPLAPTPETKPKILAGHLALRVERDQVEVCSRPFELAAASDDKTVYVACAGSGQIAAIDAELLEVRWTSAALNERVYRLLVDPLRNRLYAIGMSGQLLHVLEGSTGGVIDQIKIGRNAADLAFVPGKDRLVVTVAEPPQASLIDLAKLRIDGYVYFPSPPGFLAMRGDGEMAAASSGLWRIKVSGPEPLMEPIFLFNPSQSGHIQAELRLGGIQARKPMFIPNSSILLVPGRQSATVTVFDAEKDMMLNTIQVGAAPEEIVPSPNPQWAYTLDSQGSSITQIDLIKREAGGHIMLPSNPQDLAVAPDAAELYVLLPGDHSQRGLVAVVSLQDLSVADLIPVGKDPCNLAFTAGGRRLFVSNFLSDTVSVLE